MKRYFLSILILLTHCAYAQEIINPSFSYTDTTSGEVARAWTKNTARIFYDTTHAHTAPGCIYIYNNDYFESVCRQTIPFSPGKYRRFRLKLFMRTESRKGYAGAYARALDANGGLICKNAIPEGLITGKTAWKPYEVEFYVTADVSQLELGFYFYDKGKAWFDDVSLEEIPTEAGSSSVAQKYLGEFRDLLEQYSWHKDSTDLDAAYKNALQLIPDAQSASDCYEGIAYILDRLGDGHASFYDPATVRRWKKEQATGDKDPLLPIVEVLEDNYVSILLPGLVTQNSSIIQRYADTLHTQLLALKKKKIKGWILDLRENVGGYAPAMLAAVGPLLNIEHCGDYLTSKGKIPWLYKNGEATMDTARIKVSNVYTPPAKELPVAILTTNGTYGAGEMILAAFKGQQNTKHFGEPTAGGTYYEKRLSLSDGAMVFLTAGILADRTGKTYSGRLLPDSQIHQVYKEDLCLAKALKWLKEQK